MSFVYGKMLCLNEGSNSIVRACLRGGRRGVLRGFELGRMESEKLFGRPADTLLRVRLVFYGCAYFFTRADNLLREQERKGVADVRHAAVDILLQLRTFYRRS